MGAQALEPVFGGGMALLAQARARLNDDAVARGLDGAARSGLSVLLLDLATALMLLRAAAEGDMDPAAAGDEADRLDLPGQVARALTPALRCARAPALQVVLLQVSALAAQVLALLDALAEQSTRLPPGFEGAGPWLAPEGLAPGILASEAAETEKPRQRPEGRPRLRLVSSRELP
ncbi:hypothetical protein V5F38_11950 [Xanthobacter sp. V0B-10]|uniref:hypothetical protein n=1 Tax=Xanthobacter albus TaxID=3119929 RepID=UPI00372A8E83